MGAQRSSERVFVIVGTGGHVRSERELGRTMAFDWPELEDKAVSDVVSGERHGMHAWAGLWAELWAGLVHNVFSLFLFVSKVIFV